MPTDFTSIPLVDMSGLRSDDAAERTRVARELGEAARTVGFVYLTGHGIPQQKFDAVLAMAKTFFSLPLAEKMKVYIGNSTNHRGYVPEGEEVFYGATKDLKEAYDLSIDLPADDAEYRAGNPLVGPNQWPDVPGFREVVQDYYNSTFEVGRLLLRGFCTAMEEAPDRFEAVLKRPPSQLRMIHYPFNPEAKDVVGIGAHTDYELFTLLHATTPGLEVLNGAGVWIDAPPVPGAYVVNIGDMLEILTNGAFIATSHRVRKVSEERYSFPLFFTLDYDTRIDPLPRFVSAENPARPGLVAGEHLFAQTAQTFTYLKKRLAEGKIALPEGSQGLSSFGQEARQKVDAG
ncbi:isopenicillin N synthase family dioxygenase [Xanthobacter variabilis]|uniref:isopenicillin N synthase family dioxygenase n=1 Tax=Xanthobacter variabilis TaxID=3119932 RepID=UPI00374EC4B9